MGELWTKIRNSKLIQQTGWAFGSKIFAAGSFYLIFLFLARSMTIERFGQWNLFWSYLIIFKQVGNLGMQMSVKYFFAQHHQSTKFKALVKSSLNLRFGFSLLFSLGMGIFLILFPRSEAHLFQLSIYLITILLVFFYTFLEFHKAAFEGMHKLHLTFQIAGIEALFALITIFILYSTFGSFESIILGYAIAYLLASIYGYLKLKQLSKASEEPTKKGSNASFHRQILRYSLGTFLLSISTSLATEVDTIMVNYLTSDYETGIYGAAKQLLRYLPHISIALGMGTLPVFAVITPENKTYLRQKFKYVFGINLGIFLAIGLGILSLGPFLLPWLLGEKFSPSLDPLFALVPYIIFLAMMILTSNLLNYWGMAKVLIINQLIFFCLNILLNYLLIPLYGAFGAGISTSVSIIPLLIINLYWVRRKLL